MPPSKSVNAVDQFSSDGSADDPVLLPKTATLLTRKLVLDYIDKVEQILLALPRKGDRVEVFLHNDTKDERSSSQATDTLTSSSSRRSRKSSSEEKKDGTRPRPKTHSADRGTSPAAKHISETRQRMEGRGSKEAKKRQEPARRISTRGSGRETIGRSPIPPVGEEPVGLFERLEQVSNDEDEYQHWDELNSSKSISSAICGGKREKKYKVEIVDEKTGILPMSPAEGVLVDVTARVEPVDKTGPPKEISIQVECPNYEPARVRVNGKWTNLAK